VAVPQAGCTLENHPEQVLPRGAFVAWAALPWLALAVCEAFMHRVDDWRMT